MDGVPARMAIDENNRVYVRGHEYVVGATKALFSQSR